MQSDINRSLKSTKKAVSKDFSKSGDVTQSSSQDVFRLLSENRLDCSIEEFKKPWKNSLDFENNFKDSNMNNAESLSTSSTILAENHPISLEDDYHIKLLNDCNSSDMLLTSLSKTLGSDGSISVSDEKGIFTDKKNSNLYKNYEIESNIILPTTSDQIVDKSGLGDGNSNFTNLCEFLTTDTVVLSNPENEFKISKILHSKDFGRDLNLFQKENEGRTTLLDDLKGVTYYDSIPEYIARKRRRRNSTLKPTDGRLRKNRVNKAKLLSASRSLSSVINSENTKKDHTERMLEPDEEKQPERPGKVRGRRKISRIEEDTKKEKHNLRRSSRITDSSSGSSSSSSSNLGSTSGSGSNTNFKCSSIDSTMSPSRASTVKSEVGPEIVRGVMEMDVLENLDKMGGIKYESGSVDLRRRYRSFERLCFGLGCTVPPTKQELEMCSQLSQWGDECTLSQYETSVYQSCLLRSRSFESIWKKFCNRVIGIIRRYTLQGVHRLLRIINDEKLVEPFLKVVLIDLGSDRQDQQLFVSILHDELNQVVKEKCMLLKLSVKSNSFDDMVNQMYIQMYQEFLLGSASEKTNGKKDEVNGDINHEDQAGNMKSFESWKESQASGDNVLDALLNFYKVNFSDCELIVIIDRVNPMINDILYMFQMLKRRRLMLINSVLLVCSNSQYLERYCNSLIYSNLGIFECNMFMVSCLADDVVQVLLYDTKVQDFVPNFRMVKEIYDTFTNEDSSLTLMILRVYQLYEQYYNKYIFSYLSLVPQFVFEPLNKESQEEHEIVLEVKTAGDCSRLTSGYGVGAYINESLKSGALKEGAFEGEGDTPVAMLSMPQSEWNAIKESFEHLTLPPGSLEKQAVDVTRLSDVSTTTSMNSMQFLSKYESPNSSKSEAELSVNLKHSRESQKHIEGLGCSNVVPEPVKGARNMVSTRSKVTNEADKSLHGKVGRTLATSKHGNQRVDGNDTSQSSNDDGNAQQISSDDGNRTNASSDDKQSTTGSGRKSTSSSDDTSKRDASNLEKVANKLSEQQNNIDETTSCSSESGSAMSAENTDARGDAEERGSSEVECEHYGDMNRSEMLQRAKRLYSVYSLLSISNNMSENYVAYLELKLVMELDLQKVILELLPLNTLMLLQRRILFQLGVNLLYKLMVFLPDSGTPTNRIAHMLKAMSMFDKTASSQNLEDMEKPTKELIRRVLKYIYKKCFWNLSRDECSEVLKNIVVSFNHHYKSVIQTVMDIQVLLDGGRDTPETKNALKEMSRILEENLEVPKLVPEIRRKMHMCFFPLISTYNLSNLLVLQSYSSTFRDTSGPTKAPIEGLGVSSLLMSTPSGSTLVGELVSDYVDEEDIILYIYKYIRYRIINLWKLFIIYYYIFTSSHSSPPRELGLVEIYVKFNLNIEMLEKIYRIVLLSQTTSCAVSSKEASGGLLDRGLPEGDAQLCYLIKSSLSNINVKFL